MHDDLGDLDDQEGHDQSASADSAPPKRRGPGNPNFAPGVSGNPNGRPKGSKNRFILSDAQAVARSGKSPIEILNALATRDPKELERVGIDPAEATPAVSRWAIHELLPYVAKRQPVAVEMDLEVGARGGSIIGAEVLKFLSDEELAAIHAVMQRSQDIERRLRANEPTIDDPHTGRRMFFLDAVNDETRLAIASAASAAAGSA